MRLVSFATHVPGSRTPVADCVTAFGAPQGEAKAFARLFGIESVAAAPEDSTLEAALACALDGLDPRGPLPDTMIYVHGNPVQYPEGRSPVEPLLATHPALAGVSEVFEMDQQNCSTLFWSLDAARCLLDDGARSVVILAGDSLHQMPLAERYAPGVTAIGDAFLAMILDRGQGGLQVGEIWLRTRSRHHAGRFGTPEETAAFNADHARHVDEILDGIGFDRAGSDPILPHNVNRLVWSHYTKARGLSPDRIWLDLLPDTGHCYTVDAASMLGRFKHSDHGRAALLSVGQGGFLGGCMIEREAA